MTDTADDNDRVTRAVLRTEMAHMRELLDMHTKRWDTDLVVVKDSLSGIGRDMSEVKSAVTTFDTWCDGHEQRHGAHEEKHKTDAVSHRELHNRERGVLGTITVAGTAIAAVFGALWPRK